MSLKKIKRELRQLSPTAFLEEFQSKKREMAQIYEQRRQLIREVDQPLALVTQVQRSGGTLISQLFDSHPQCLAHPHELKIGYPQKENWPQLSLDDPPESWFATLFEGTTTDMFRQGYHKSAKQKENKEFLPFLLAPRLQRDIFLRRLRETPPAGQRDILNAYFTSYFNAWLDYTGWGSPKKWITAFTPKIISTPETIDRFFSDYPDSKVITLIRQPRNWYASYRVSKTKHYKTLPRMVEQWVESARGSIDAARRYPGKVLVLNFEDLVTETEAAMRRCADFLEIEWDATLTQPTFQNMELYANSHFSVASKGIVRSNVKRDDQLTQEDIEAIDSLTSTLYEEAQEYILGQTTP
jgi:hypothetical protein